MKKAINILGWLFVTLTMIALIFTILSTYAFVRQIPYFNSYYALQICLVVTMITWAIKMNTDKNYRAENRACSICCTIIAAGAMVFFYLGVF